MKALRLIPVLDFGGVESQFVTLAETWASEEIQLEFCTFWKDRAAANELRALGYKVHVLNQAPSIRNPRATLALLKLLRELRPNIVHSTIGEANFHNMLCAPLGPWKTIIEEAGIPSRSLRNRLVHAGLYRTCDRIIAVSQASADYLTSREWAPKDKVIVLPNSVHPRLYAAARAVHSLGSPRVFRAVGRLTAVKNYEMLIRAFAEAHALAPSIHLEIVGEGEERPSLEAQIQAFGAQDFITLRGFVSDIVSLHQDTDFFLMPSLSEGFGLAAAEPMAMGIPGLGSRVGGLFTVFGELADDWLLDATDENAWAQGIAMLAAMPEDEYKKTACRFGRQAERFSPERYVSALESLYKASINSI